VAGPARGQIYILKSEVSVKQVGVLDVVEAPGPVHLPVRRDAPEVPTHPDLVVGIPSWGAHLPEVVDG
jgi:hypothetical protein